MSQEFQGKVEFKDDVVHKGPVTMESALILNEGTQAAEGAGVSDAETNNWKVYTIGGITYTVGNIDITALTSDATDTGVIGEEGAANSYFTQITAATNGYIFEASIVCVEAPAGGEVDLDLVFDTTATTEGAAATDVVLAAGADWTIGASKHTMIADTALTAGLADYYVHLAVGTSSSPTNGTYTAGKYVVILKGVKAF
jgi:hypothetical protein